MVPQSKWISELVELDSASMTAAVIGEKFELEIMKNSTTTDCIVDSLFGVDDQVVFHVHWKFLNHWLPTLPGFRYIRLRLSTTAIVLLLEIVYYKKITNLEPLMELVDYAAQSNACRLLNFLIEGYFEEMPQNYLFWCWRIARKDRLKCEMRLKQLVGENIHWMLQDGIDGVESFLTASVKDILDIARDDQVDWQSGKILTEVLLSWCRINGRIAKDYCKELFSTIRFKTMSERRECLTIFCETFIEMGMDESDVVEKTTVYSSMKPRVPHQVLLYLGGWGAKKGSSAVLFYDKYTNHWAGVPVMELPMKMAYHRVLQIGQYLYCFGGYDFASFKTEVWRFDFEKLVWEWKSVLPDDRGYFAAVTFKSKVYLFGGYDFTGRLSTNILYDPERNRWEPLPFLTVGRSDTAATVYRGRILVSGGFDGERTLNRVDVFDPKKPEEGWTEFVPLRDRRSAHCLVVFRGVLYALGGFQHGSSTSSCEYFDNVSNEWRTAPSMNCERSTFAAAIFNDAIYVIGGHTANVSTALVEKFDGTQWRIDHSLPKPMAAGAVVHVQNPKNMAVLLQRSAEW
ncbi:hypothetical protein FO519_000005 [Halicephalobus sp. NKZ332]|nr:hypothetical protein FO519_000005 [Halicephalobus sp. NKZ332]